MEIVGPLVLMLLLAAGVGWMVHRVPDNDAAWGALAPPEPDQRDPAEGPGAYDPRAWRHPPGRG